MSVYVVDVSVAVKWFVPEIREVQAASLLDDQNRLLAPDLIYSEFANIIWKKTYLRSELSASQGTHIINNFPNAPLQIFSSADLFSYAFDLACETGRTAYDCMYLALALAHDEALITDDERFYNSLRNTSYASSVVWLGNL